MSEYFNICGEDSTYEPPSCEGITFDGVENVTINQGLGIDLTDGVTAYDKDGNEIPYEVSPEEINKCEVGEHFVKYKAYGEDTNLVPSTCGEDMVHQAEFCKRIRPKTVTRTVTIEQADPPTISGMTKATIAVDTDFDPMSGVSAVDDNGNAVAVTYSGKMDEDAEGNPVTFETEYAQNAKKMEVSFEPIQDLSNGQPSPDNIAPISGWDIVGVYNNVKRYGVKWNGVDNVCTERLFDASGITLDTTDFCHKGTLNEDYNNPFDNIYPWSEMKQCNVDLRLYRNGNSLKDSIVAWYGDDNFVTKGTDEIFVGRYRPEFWYTRYADEQGNIIWVVAESEIVSYTHAKEAVDGIGFAVDDGNGGVTCGDGQPMTNIAVNQIQARARTSGIELQNIYSLDAQIALYLVEYANTNIQRALGDGCSSQYRQNANDIVSAVNGNTVTIPLGAQSFCVKGATIDFGASSGAVVLANRREVQSYEISGSDLIITLDEPLPSTAVGLYASFHGMTNADCIGNWSGYLGVNGKNNAMYRGAVMYTNRWQYILGIYRQSGTNRIWLSDEDDAMDYTALNVNVHRDTGRALPILSAGTWLTVGKLNFMEGVNAFAPVREAGGNSVSPIGDQQYVPSSAVGNTVLLFGGRADHGWSCGVFYGYWNNSSGYSYWGSSARPLLTSHSNS